MKTPATHAEWCEQILRYLSGALTKDEISALSKALREKPELRKALAQLARQQVFLGELGEEAKEARRMLHGSTRLGASRRVGALSNRSSGKWSWRRIVPIAAMLMLTASLGYWLLFSESKYKIVELEGEVQVEHNGRKSFVELGALISPGDVIATSVFSSVKLQCSRLTATIKLSDQSTLAIPYDSENVFRLESGSLNAKVGHRIKGSEVYFNTPTSTTKVIGTEFRLVANRERTHILMNEGRVEFSGSNENAPTSVSSSEMGIAALEKKTLVGQAPKSSNGTGLRGDYYTGSDWKKFIGTRIDPEISQTITSFQHNLAPFKKATDNFSVRWTGWIEPRFTETYTFELNADDGAKLWIDDQLIADAFWRRAEAHEIGTIALTAGKKHTIKVSYFQGIKNAAVRLYWSSDSQPREVVPQSQLFPLDASVH